MVYFGQAPPPWGILVVINSVGVILIKQAAFVTSRRMQYLYQSDSWARLISSSSLTDFSVNFVCDS